MKHGLLFLLVLAAQVAAGATLPVRGFSLTEWDKHLYDANNDPTATTGKTESQLVVDKLYDLGVRQINLSPRATMASPWDSEMTPITPPNERGRERQRYLRLIRYIKSKGMTVGMRPIFFVVDSAGKTPYVNQPAQYQVQALQTAAQALRSLSMHTLDAQNAIAQARHALQSMLETLSANATHGDVPQNDDWVTRRARNLLTRIDEQLTPATGTEQARLAGVLAAKAEQIASKQDWWHGNIEPSDPNKWFESFKTYLDAYLSIATQGKVEEFTLGAELYSMTVGIEDRWDEQPYGFPRQWVDVLGYARNRLPKGCRIMYDINFTDDKIEAGGLDQFGGEFARWRYRLVDLAGDQRNHDAWQNLVDFWKGLDAIGLDVYRSLATNQQSLPTSQAALVALLKKTSDRYATQIDNALSDIQGTPGIDAPKDVILKEIGYRSVTNGFIDPFVYASNGGELNLNHQAAAYEAIFQSFWAPNWDWFKGVVFWDASVDMNRQGSLDVGFSPIGKAPTEDVLKKYFHD